MARQLYTICGMKRLFWWVAASFLVGACGGGGGGTGGGGTGGSGGAGGGIPCGDAGTCTDGTYCSWHYASCGESDIDFQECSSQPATCDGTEPPVCACDGKVYDNFCDAANQGVQVGYKGGCQVPAGFFSCGSKLCKQGEQYCRRQEVGDAMKLECLELPSGCSACDCLPGVEAAGGGGGSGGSGGGSGCTCTANGADLDVECPPSF